MVRSWNYPLREGMAHESVFAVRLGVGWRVFAWKCHPNDVEAEMAGKGMVGKEWRLISHRHIRQDLCSDFSDCHDLSGGWQREPGTENWFPLEEPLPRISGKPTESSVSITLDYICHGIHWSVASDECKICSFIDEMEDSLILWTRFVELLENGENPHAILCSKCPTQFIVQAEAAPDMCRFYVRDDQNHPPETIDIVVKRSDLTQEFRRFLNEIADHPCFAHSYILCGDFPDSVYEPIDDAAAAEWQLAVNAGRFAKDDWDAESDFIERYIADRLPIPDDLAAFVEKYREMLKTLVIPDDWKDWE